MRKTTFTGNNLKFSIYGRCLFFFVRISTSDALENQKKVWVDCPINVLYGMCHIRKKYFLSPGANQTEIQRGSSTHWRFYTFHHTGFIPRWLGTLLCFKHALSNSLIIANRNSLKNLNMPLEKSYERRESPSS